jgi:hypothetical protein
MKTVTNTIDLNATPKFYTLSQIMQREHDEFKDWNMRNDMINRVVVQSCDHGFLSLGIDFGSGKQGVGYGYRSEGNIGIMALHLARLVGCYATNGDILARLAATPIRVLHRDDFGGSVAKNTYIGHFMEDRWMYCHDWILAGVVKEDETEARDA